MAERSVNGDNRHEVDNEDLERLIECCDGSVAKAAKSLGISRQALYKRLKRKRGKIAAEHSPREKNVNQNIAISGFTRDELNAETRKFFELAKQRNSFSAAAQALNVAERTTRPKSGDDEGNDQKSFVELIREASEAINALDEDERLVFACSSFCSTMGIDPLGRDPVELASRRIEAERQPKMKPES